MLNEYSRKISGETGEHKTPVAEFLDSYNSVSGRINSDRLSAAVALESKDILAAAISIHNAECQHRCAINIMNLIVPPNDVAFEEALTLPQVQDAVAPFGI